MSFRPVHDRRTWISYAQIAAWAWFVYAYGATVALLRDEQGTTRALSSVHGSLLATGSLVGGLIAPWLIRRWGRGVLIRRSAIGAMLGIGLYTWPAAGPLVTMPGVFLTGLAGAGLLVVSVNAFLMEHQGPAGPAALTEANAFASLAGLLGPAVVGLGAATFLGWRVGPWVSLVGLVVVELWRGRDLRGYGTPSGAMQERHAGRMPASVSWTVFALVCFMAAEFSMTLWSADLMREQLGLSPASAAAALSLLTGGMFVGRTAGSRIVQRTSAERLLRGSIVLSLLGFALTWWATWAWLALVGLFLVGLGISVQFPLGVARAMRASGGLNDRVSALVAVWGSVGIALAPFGLGALSQTVGLHLAFLIVPTLLLASLVVIIARPVADGLTEASREAQPG